MMMVLFIIPLVHSQNKAEAALSQLDADYPQEKVILLLDKSSYAAGDRLGFKAFVVDGYSLSTKSTSLFVELYNQDKKTIGKLMLPLYNMAGRPCCRLANPKRTAIWKPLYATNQ